MNQQPIKLVRRSLPPAINIDKTVEADAVLDEIVRMLCESQPLGYQLGGLMWGDDALHVTWIRDESNVISLEVLQE